MKRILTGFLSALLLVIMSAGSLPAYADAVTPTALADEILHAQMEKDGIADVQTWVDSLAETVGDGREWYVFALAADKNRTLHFSAYANALNAFLAEESIPNAVTRQKYALVLLACGYESDFVRNTQNDSLGKLGIMSYVFGLHMATSGHAPDGKTADDIVTELLALRRADGGFSVSEKTSNADVTAMALQALAPYYGTREDVTLAVDGALALLSETQNDEGGFSSYGTENPESTAQVIIALCSLGIDPFSDERFIKNGNTMMDALLRFRTEDGGFSHILSENANATATMQVFLAMTAAEQLAAGSDPLYLLQNSDKRTYLEMPDEKTRQTAPNYRGPALIGIAALAGVTCIILFLCKKRNYKTFLTVGILAAAAILIVLFTDIQSTDSYYNGTSEPKGESIGEVTLSIRCDVLVGKTDSEYVPQDGIILNSTAFEIEEGDTVYSILEEASRRHRIQIETKGTNELVYVEGIAYLYELEFGDLSGWIYSVNGESASVGCGNYILSDGDVIEWDYTLDLGRDIS